jgi:hypothetical protein
MERLKEKRVGKEDLFVGIDLHKQRCHVTIRTFDVEVWSGMPIIWEKMIFHKILCYHAFQESMPLRREKF